MNPFRCFCKEAWLKGNMERQQSSSNRYWNNSKRQTDTRRSSLGLINTYVWLVLFSHEHTNTKLNHEQTGKRSSLIYRLTFHVKVLLDSKFTHSSSLALKLTQVWFTTLGIACDFLCFAEFWGTFPKHLSLLPSDHKAASVFLSQERW